MRNFGKDVEQFGQVRGKISVYEEFFCIQSSKVSGPVTSAKLEYTWNLSFFANSEELITNQYIQNNLIFLDLKNELQC